MVDAFVLLQLPNAGDELQAIKKGIVELADLVVVNKADIDPRATEVAQRQIQGALDLLRHPSPRWKPPVLTVSALANQGSRRSGATSGATGTPCGRPASSRRSAGGRPWTGCGASLTLRCGPSSAIIRRCEVTCRASPRR